MGSEMCIRDSKSPAPTGHSTAVHPIRRFFLFLLPDEFQTVGAESCLLYTSDAADERSSVDLGGRRIIKKKNSGD